MTQEWNPVRSGESETSHPVKDLGCDGPSTAIGYDPGVTWAQVKARLHRHLAERLDLGEDQWLFRAMQQINRDEPDQCALGITCVSAFLLPLSMPKFRNMARVLSTDLNFLVLKVTFYDTLRSGFPVFGIMDGLASEEYLSWWGSPESLIYFPPRPEAKACGSSAAAALRDAVGRLRSEAPAGPAHAAEWARPPVAEATELFVAGEAASSRDPGGCGASVGTAPCGPAASSEAAGACPQAQAAALLVWALARAFGAELGGAQGNAPVQAALRDVIHLVSRAEEIIRAHMWDDGATYAELIASPWHLWWLLHRIQLALPRLVPLDLFSGASSGPPPGAAARRSGGEL